jgi:ubiquinone/menaquinone biosynthesis C-methylase UbiE
MEPRYKGVPWKERILSSEKMIRSIRMKWNEAACKNVRYYIATSAFDSEEKFIDSGKYDAEKILSGLPRFNPKTDCALEIGCGIGRLLRAMNEHFCSLHGVDISDEMIRCGRNWLRGYSKIKLVQTTRNNLDIFDDNQFDFVFSYITFQHIPSRRLIMKYIAEAYRVLKPGGYFRFQTHRSLSLVGLLRNRIRIFLYLYRKKDYFAGYS